MKKTTKLIIAAGLPHCCKGKSLYEVLETAEILKITGKIEYDEIILLDNESYVIANSRIKTPVQQISSTDFKTEPDMNYLLVLNLDNNAAIARTISRLGRDGTVTFQAGTLKDGKLILEEL